MNSDEKPPVKVTFFLGLFQGKSLKPTIILIYTIFAMTFWWYLPPRFFPADAPRRAEIFDKSAETPYFEAAANTAVDDSALTFWLGETRTLGALFLMGIFPVLIVKFVFREKLSDYGVRLGNRFTLRSLLIFTPLMILLAWLSSCNSGFPVVYPYNLAALSGAGPFLLHSAVYFLCYYLSWEFLFRGFLQHGLEDSCGVFNAVLIQSLAAAALHFGHPMTETLGAFGGSIFWGFLVLRTRSLLSGAVQHAVLGIFLNMFIAALPR